MKKLGFYYHFYKEWKSWAIVLSITTANTSIQFGPFWFSVAYPAYD